MIIVEGLVGCAPCKILHNKLLNEGISHRYVTVPGEDGVCYPHVIVDGIALAPMTIEGYVQKIKEITK